MSESEALKPLNPRERQFVREYLVDLNPQRAARDVGYSPANARNASRILKKPNVAAVIQAAMAQRAERAELSAQWVLDELQINVANAKGTEEWGAVNQALQLIGKHLGMFKEQHEHTGKDGGAITVNVVRSIVRPSGH